MDIYDIWTFYGNKSERSVEEIGNHVLDIDIKGSESSFRGVFRTLPKHLRWNILWKQLASERR